MSKKPNRLGRGLESLVSDLRAAPQQPPKEASTEQADAANSRETRDSTGVSEGFTPSAERPEGLTSPRVSEPFGSREGPEAEQVSSAFSRAATMKSASSAETRLTGQGSRGGASVGLTARMVATGSLMLNPYQPRSVASDEGVESLAGSLRVSGMIQPITVRLVEGGYQIIAGERRWRAATLAGWEQVPVLVREADDRQMLELALVENIQREDLNPMDRARAYGVYCDRFGFSAEQMAERLGEDRSTVANYLRLLDLEDEICAMVADGRLTMGHARCVVGVADVGTRLRLARAAVVNQLSVRALEEIVRRGKKGLARQGDGQKKDGLTVSPHVRELETMLSQATGTKVRVQIGRRKGSGRMIIEFYSLDDFDRISALLGMPPSVEARR